MQFIIIVPVNDTGCTNHNMERNGHRYGVSAIVILDMIAKKARYTFQEETYNSGFNLILPISCYELFWETDADKLTDRFWYPL